MRYLFFILVVAILAGCGEDDSPTPPSPSQYTVEYENVNIIGTVRNPATLPQKKAVVEFAVKVSAE
jgi:uncharacterized protein YceK